MLHVICTRLRPGHLSARAGDGSRRSEEIVKNSTCAFECDYYYIIIIPLVCPGVGEELRDARLHCSSLLPSEREWIGSWGRYHGGRRPSSDDSLHSPTVILPSALNKPSIMKRYHHRRTCSHTSPHRSPRMVTFHDTRFVECRWWNDG